MKRPRRLFVLAALCGTVALAGWVGAGLAGLGSLGIESTGAPIEVSDATSATAHAEHVDAPQATAPGEHGVTVADIASGSAALSEPPPTSQPPAPGAVAWGASTCSARAVADVAAEGLRDRRHRSRL